MFQITPADAGTRVDAFLAAKLQISRARAQKLLETALIGEKTVKSSYVLRADDQIFLEMPDETEDETPKISLDGVILPEILWQDDEMMVLNKPVGLIVHAGAGETGVTLVEILRALKIPLSSVGPDDRAGIVHRLDKDTSGVMLVAKTDAAHWKLASDFEERRVDKRYFALVNAVPPLRGRIEAPIKRSNSNRTKMTVAPGGRQSVTEYEVERKWEKFAALNIQLLTGRTHQIRVHLAYIGCPVVGDAVYGGRNRALQNAPNDAMRAALENLDGQALHAQKIGFFHPTTGEKLSFEAPLPEKIAAVVATLTTT